MASGVCRALPRVGVWQIGLVSHLCLGVTPRKQPFSYCIVYLLLSPSTRTLCCICDTKLWHVVCVASILCALLYIQAVWVTVRLVSDDGLAVYCSPSHSLSRSLASVFSYTHMHSLSLCISLSFFLFLSFFCSRSHLQTRAHTYTHTHTRTHTRTHAHTHTHTHTHTSESKSACPHVTTGARERESTCMWVRWRQYATITG